MANRHLAYASTIALLLASYVQEPAVVVTRSGQTLDIAVSRPGTVTPTCIESLTISKDGSDIATTPPLWELSTADRARCRATFTYGRVPDGYAQGGSAPALSVGSRYLVEVSGPGLLGGVTFTMRDTDGVLSDAAAR